MSDYYEMLIGDLKDQLVEAAEEYEEEKAERKRLESGIKRLADKSNKCKDFGVRNYCLELLNELHPTECEHEYGVDKSKGYPSEWMYSPCKKCVTTTITILTTG